MHHLFRNVKDDFQNRYHLNVCHFAYTHMSINCNVCLFSVKKCVQLNNRQAAFIKGVAFLITANFAVPALLCNNATFSYIANKLSISQRYTRIRFVHFGCNQHLINSTVLFARIYRAAIIRQSRDNCNVCLLLFLLGDRFIFRTA